MNQLSFSYFLKNNTKAVDFIGTRTQTINTDEVRTDHDSGVRIDPHLITYFLLCEWVTFSLYQGVKGSCASFKTRKDVTRRFNDGDLDSFEKMTSTFNTNRIVFVASQASRARVLIGPNYDPLLAAHLTPMQWIILERIGRARHQGEMTHGKLSLNFTKEPPNTLFYHRKVLVLRNLITKQVRCTTIKLKC